MIDSAKNHKIIQKGLDFRLERSVIGPALVELGGFRAAPLACRREVGVAPAAPSAAFSFQWRRSRRP
jgi:hypothetical protein